MPTAQVHRLIKDQATLTKAQASEPPKEEIQQDETAAAASRDKGKDISAENHNGRVDISSRPTITRPSLSSKGA